MTGTPLAVASVILETDGKVIKVWTEELLNSTQEIIMTGVVVKKEDQLDQQVWQIISVKVLSTVSKNQMDHLNMTALHYF